MTTIQKANLNFTLTDTGYECEELKKLPLHFAERWSEDEIAEAISCHLNVIKEAHRIRTEENLSDEEETQKRNVIFDRIVEEQKFDTLPLFNRFLTVLGDWWYYCPDMAINFCSHKWESNYRHTAELLHLHLLPVLPEEVRKVLKSMEIVNVAVGFGHFAILAINGLHGRTRRIVTDTQLFELRDVYGYTYLDILPNGKPVARSVTSRGGERAFFDGTHLMSHKKFMTCAPKTVALADSGYKVNSTGVTIVNGALYPLIDEDDVVAHSEGVFMGINPWNRKDQLKSLTLAEKSAKKLEGLADNVLKLDEKEYSPMGLFEPSEVTLLDSGFALYEWSNFMPVFCSKYRNVLVIDDNIEWLNIVETAFAEQHQVFTSLKTQDRFKALEKVLTDNPEALVLDMHLTGDEQFDGLWIANQLFEHGFVGDIIIASSYGDDALRAMRTLIKGKVMIPGKNIDRIRKCLSADS